MVTAGGAGRSDAGSAEGGAGIGELVRSWRERALLTQEQLAARAGLSLRTVRRLESGEGGRPRSSSLGLLAAAFELSEADQEVLVSAAWGRPAGPAAGSSAGRPVRPAADGFRRAEDVPRQLPAAPPGFIGRAAELADLGRAQETGAVVISAIDGMAGIGKTALAVHAAHRLAGDYPDGQLFLDLHGYTEGVPPLDPGEALNRVLRALGVPEPQIPVHVEERAALFRSRLADRKFMVVLDNAADEAQVEPLLPGTPGCLVLITSRRLLAGLDHTHAVSLDVLPPRDATILFADAAGRQRLAGEPSESVAEAVELCGRLPLAIRIAAARLRSRPAWTMSDLVARLRDDRRRLAELGAGPRSVTAALDLSYRELDARLRRAHRLLGLHPGADFDIHAAAALLDTAPGGAEQATDQLLDAHLLQELTPGRFRFHDLVRQHAMATAAHEEPEADRHAALTRLLDHYRHAASVAMDVGYPYERARRPDVPPAESRSPGLRDETEATGWLDRELPNLLAVAAYAADHGRPDHIRHLSAVLQRHLRTRGRYADAEVLHSQALTTARGVGDRRGEAEALVGLAHAYRSLGRMPAAWDHFRAGLTAARAGGHLTVELDALVYLGHLNRMQNNQNEPAAAHYDEARELARARGDHQAEMEALIGLGWVHLSLGQDAHDEFARALDIAQALGHRIAESTTVEALGFVHKVHGRYEQAISAFEQALDIARAVGSRERELAALTSLGGVHRLMGRPGRAADCYRRVHSLAREVNSPLFQFEACDGIGVLHLAEHSPDQALAEFERALLLATDLEQPLAQARAHDGLARAHLALDRPDEARRHWEQALLILTTHGIERTVDDHATPATIRAHLDRLARPGDAED